MSNTEGAETMTETMSAADYWEGSEAADLDLSADSTAAEVAHAAAEWVEDAAAEGIKLTGALEFAQSLVRYAEF